MGEGLSVRLARNALPPPEVFLTLTPGARRQAEMAENSGNGAGVSAAGFVKSVRVGPPGSGASGQGAGFGFSREALEKALRETERELSPLSRELRFEILEEAGVVQLQVIDARKGKVVRKVPSDEVVRFLALLKKRALQDGLVNLRA
jgi:hypothetical protein